MVPGNALDTALLASRARAPRGLLYETVLVLLITFVPLLLVPLIPALLGFATLLALIFPIAYLFIEKWTRRRPWKELGIKRRGFSADFWSNWRLVILVVVVLQVIPVALFLALPDGIGHILARIPAVNTIAVAIVLIIVLALREELVFRSLFQARFTWYIGNVPAIVFVSLIFALSHLTEGSLLVVAVDLLFVFLDGVVYGLIFARSNNVLLAWAAHVSADLVGLALLVAASLAIV
ncbi:MAG TPA: type II CAAX endopeptidase family protein [Candidatus Bathyarchaeia archaeon]|nr:type II CAAX endopeptidase family protein [Candidatus Bathyarchaeia archaeon]